MNNNIAENKQNIRIKKIDDLINFSNIALDTKIIIENNCIESFNSIVIN